MSNPRNFQNDFLGSLIAKQTPVAIYLKNGIKLKGTIGGYDRTAIFLEQPGQQVIYISAVSTVVPLITLAMVEET